MQQTNGLNFEAAFGVIFCRRFLLYSELSLRRGCGCVVLTPSSASPPKFNTGRRRCVSHHNHTTTKLKANTWKGLLYGSLGKYEWAARTETFTFLCVVLFEKRRTGLETRHPLLYLFLDGLARQSASWSNHKPPCAGTCCPSVALPFTYDAGTFSCFVDAMTTARISSCNGLIRVSINYALTK